MWLIVGLGNPGPRYETTRHNIGFMAVDQIAARGIVVGDIPAKDGGVLAPAKYPEIQGSFGAWSSKNKCLFASGNFTVKSSSGKSASGKSSSGSFSNGEASHRIVLAKPQTFMNCSGEAVVGILNFFKGDISRLIVIYDELDLPFGSVRLKQGGGEAGHNGLKSISQHLSNKNYLRMRLGIGRPANSNIPIADWVLSRFSGAELSTVDTMCNDVGTFLSIVLTQGFTKAQSLANSFPQR